MNNQFENEMKGRLEQLSSSLDALSTSYQNMITKAIELTNKGKLSLIPIDESLSRHNLIVSVGKRLN